MAILAVFALTTLVILAAYANDTLHVGASGYGLFNTLIATGALTGALSSTWRTGVRLRTVMMTGVLCGGVQALGALMLNGFGLGAILVAPGVANLLFITAASSLVQLSSNLGVQAIGGPLTG